MKKKLGRPPLGRRAMTAAERMRRHRARLPKAKGKATKKRDPLSRYEDVLDELRRLCTLFPAEMVLYELRGLINRVMSAEEERVKAGRPVVYPVHFIAGSLR